MAADEEIFPFFTGSTNFVVSTGGVSSLSAQSVGWMAGGTGGGTGGPGEQISTTALYFYHVTLDADMITNKFIDLPKGVAAGQDQNVILDLKGFGEQFYEDDYEVDESVRSRITWDGLGLEDLVQVGDKIRVQFI